MGGIVVERHDQTVSELLKTQGPIALSRSMSEMAGMPRFPEMRRNGSVGVGSAAAMASTTGSIMALMDSEARHDRFYSQRFLPQSQNRHSHSHSSFWKDLKQMGSRRSAKKWQPIYAEEEHLPKSSKKSKKAPFWKRFLLRITAEAKRVKSPKSDVASNAGFEYDLSSYEKNFDKGQEIWQHHPSFELAAWKQTAPALIKSQSMHCGVVHPEIFHIPSSVSAPVMQRQISAPLWQRRKISPVENLDSTKLKMNRSVKARSAASMAMAQAVRQTIPE